MDEIVIINYEMGNLRSVQKSLERIGVKAIISNDLRKVEAAKKLILPGVGHFASAVRKIKEFGLWDLLNHKVVSEKVPILGICLGMQLMAKYSEEGNESGFGWFDADVLKFNVEDKIKFKIPHIGWNSVEIKKNNPLFKEIQAESQFYFVHSYHFNCNNPLDVLTITRYESDFVSSVLKQNILGVQFHPEKSHEQGERLLLNFKNF